MSSISTDDVSLNALRAIFGHRAVLFNEDPAAYDALLVLVAADVKPETMREWLLVKDIVDAQWEFARIRGFKAGLLHTSLPTIIANQMREASGKELTPQKAKIMREQLLKVVTGQAKAREAFAQLLGEYQLTMDCIAAAAFERLMPRQIELEDRADAVRGRRYAAYDELRCLHEARSRRPVALPPLVVDHIDTPIERSDLAEVAEGANAARSPHEETTTPAADAAERNACRDGEDCSTSTSK